VRTPLVEGLIKDHGRAHGLSEDQVVREVILAFQPNKRFVTLEELVLQPGPFGQSQYFHIGSAAEQNGRGSALSHISLILLASSKGPGCSISTTVELPFVIE
jgi:hypothetical protein